MTTVIAEQLKDCQDTDEKPKRRLEVHTARAWLALTFCPVYHMLHTKYQRRGIGWLATAQTPTKSALKFNLNKKIAATFYDFGKACLI